MFINQIKTFTLLAAISGLLIFAGKFVGGPQGALIALLFAVIINFFTYFFSDKMVLAAYGAVPLDSHKYSQIYAMVADLAAQAQIPMPKLFLIEHPMANAFATGRNPKHASVAVTSGILRLLSEDELRGVLAHELSHVKNRDILIASVAATFAMAISYIASMIRWSYFWGSSRRNENSSGLGSLIAAIIMPIAAMLIQLAISRSREYEADATGAQISKSPLALASALQKISGSTKEHTFHAATYAQQAASSMFICNPFSGESLARLFSTHPPTKDRVMRLEKMNIF
jgi:heat shock protein HtpX